MRQRLLSCLLLPAALFSRDPTLAPHGTIPRKATSDYPVQTVLGGHTLAAEYMVRSFQGRNHTFFTKDYLVVEVALYGPKFARLLVSNGHFSLRINGKKQALLPQAPSFVAASLRYPDWEMRPRIEAGAGVGDRGVIIGDPPVARFPGDPRDRPPRIPRTPEPPGPGGVEKEEPARADEVAVESALPEGELVVPVSGYLYFPSRAKPKSIRSLELLYQGPAGSATLRLL